MPGTPDPVIGSDAVTIVLAASLALVTVLWPLRAFPRSAVTTRLVPIGSVAYAAVAILLWFGVRAAFYHHVIDPAADPVGFSLIVTVAVIVFALQAAIPLYLYASRGLVVPLVVLAAVTTVLFFTFLRVGGESDPIGLYAFAFGPLVIGILLVGGAFELGVRRALSAIAPHVAK